MASIRYATRGTIPALGEVWQPVGATSTVLTAHLVPLEAARPFVPAGLPLVPVWPGYTLGATLLSYYGPESTLEYHELVVTAGLVRYRGAIAPFVSHIYVNHEDSVTGGRRMGLPKEMARFDWDGAQPGVASLTRHDGVPLCTIRYARPSFTLPLTLAGPTITTIGDAVWRFTSKMRASWGLAQVRFDVPATSPFAALQLGRPLLGLVAGRMRGEMGLGMHALGPLGGEPRVVG